MNLELKISRRIHPLPKIVFRMRTKLRGVRSRQLAAKHGTPIDAKGDHLHIYLTLRCDLGCYFCVNLQYANRPAQGWHEVSADQWLTYLNRLYNLEELYLQGGEPLLHRGFVDILNGLDGFNICVYTHLPRQSVGILSRLKPRNNNIIFLCSYHPLNDKRAVNEYVDDFRQIPRGIKKQVHIIEVPEVSYMLYARAFRRYGIYLERADVSVLTQHNPIAQNQFARVLCNSHMEVVSPDMRVYRCLGLMLRHYDDYTKHLKDYDFTAGFQECRYYGLCGQCSTAKEIRRLE